MASTPFFSGKHTAVKAFVDGSPVAFKTQSWTAKQNSTMCEDGLVGEDRPHLQRLVQTYDVNLTCFARDLVEIMALLTDVDNDDAAVQPLTKGLAMSFKPLDGTKGGFQLSGEVVIGDWELAIGGQTERAKVTVPFKAQYFKPVASL